jgi:hypothetical protein
MSVRLSSLRDEAMQDLSGEKRGLLGACRVLTGRPLFSLRWVGWWTGEGLRRTLSQLSRVSMEYGTDAIILAMD